VKKALVFILTICAIATAQDLPKIAVYVTGDVSDNEKKALGTRMLASLVSIKRYRGIERSNAFLAEIEKEQIRQRSGEIDDNQISALGKQFGVKFVCIADLTPAFGEFQVSARIVNVETAEVEFIGESSGPLKSMADLERVSDQVVKNMFIGQVSIPKSEPKSEARVPAADNNQTVSSSSVMTLVDSRNGKRYKTVRVGSKMWMAKNLDYNVSGSKCYDNNPTNCDKYGRLYNWPTAKSVCPTGFHLPSDDEWTMLTDYVGGEDIAGTKLKSTTGWNGWRGVPAGSDNYGFSALPGGGSSGGSGNIGYWWSATESGVGNAWGRGMRYNGADVYRNSNDKMNLFSVRCVAD